MIFIPYYDPSPPLCEVVDNSMSSFWRNLLGIEVMFYLISRWPATGIDLSSVVHQIISYTFYASSQGFTRYGHQIRGINIVAIYYLECGRSLQYLPPGFHIQWPLSHYITVFQCWFLY